MSNLKKVLFTILAVALYYGGYLVAENNNSQNPFLEAFIYAIGLPALGFILYVSQGGFKK